ncbi:leucine-rich repeat serine/threonine-protein kinase 2-like isoform X1 [Hydractinia symbiolongicarpus]|uniref:leucine-rich repeat serine/threonine-protein kinase 2-like isoform X1 n=1 Tax=Hydractinia symbiolongicarpus TaxID=13093 RepID=UPI00254C4695|nr:leucine-rich repeat serine/threonine-protein kinase 2-like isoform X1 [Hydractinia symbiolongicarpus]
MELQDDGVLHLEGLENFLNHYQSSRMNFQELIRSSEHQITSMNTALHYLKKKNLAHNEVIELFKMLLGVDEYEQSPLPPQFFDLLSHKDFLKKIVRYLDQSYFFDSRIQQLCVCVLTNVLQNTTEKNLFTKGLQNKSKFYTDIANIIKFCFKADEDSYRYNNCVNTLTLTLNMLKQLRLCQAGNVDEKYEISILFYQLVLQCLTRFIGEEDLCELSLELLRILLGDKTDEMERFIFDRRYDLLVKAMTENPHNETIIQSSCMCMVNLTTKGDELYQSVNTWDVSFDESAEIALASLMNCSSTIITFLLDRLGFYSDDVIFIEHILNAISQMAKLTSYCEGLLDHDAIEIMLKMMSHLRQDSTIQTSAIHILAQLKEAENEGTTDSQWLVEIFAAMISHQDNAQVQQAACQALSSRIASNPSVCNFIGEESASLLPLHSSVLAALNIHSKDVFVFQASCSAIFQMAVHSKVLQQYLVAKGAYVSIIKEMRALVNDVEIHGWGCHALRALAFRNPYQEELMYKYDILTILAENLKFFTNLTVLKESTGLLACLATDLEIVKRQSVYLRIPDIILRIAVENVFCEELVEMALEAIAIFSTSEEQPLLKLECVRDIRHVMTANKANETVQRLGCIIMQLMAADQSFISDDAVSLEVLQIIRDAMIRFKDIISVQTEGCIALYLLVEHEEEISRSIKKRAIEMKIHDLLFPIIEDFKKNDEITLLAQQCLIEITSDKKKNIVQSSRDEVLHRACFLGHIKCAEYMLQLGADVDAGNPSALCTIALSGNTKLVELLLSYDASEAATALTMCLEEQDWDMAGILLRHLGYEKENGAITWSAMKIKEVPPELLFPTLTSKVCRINPPTSANVTPIKSVKMRNRLRATSFNKEETDPFQTPRRSHESMNSTPLRNRSSSDLSTNDLLCSGGRQINTRSGTILPYNTLDPRLVRRNSGEKHTIVTSPKEELEFYPGHRDGMLASEMTDKDFCVGHLVDRCVTPVMVEKTREAIRKSLSDLNLMKKQGRCEPFQTPDAAPPCKMKKQNSPRQRAKTWLTPFREEISDDIKQLDVSHNNIRDLDNLATCPSTLISEFFHKLECLDLSDNMLTEMPASLSQSLPRLKVLNVSTNQIARFPYEIFKHQRIETVDISNNLVSNVKPSLLQVAISLTKLDISRNKLREFPSWIGRFFPRLGKLFLSQNEIKEIPNSAKGFRALVELNMSRNYLVSVSGTFISECTSLEKVDFSHNQLINLPKYTPNTLSRLSTVKLSHNQLKDKRPFFIPQLILSIPSLQFVDLSHNMITQLPETQYWASKSLRDLLLSHNRIRKLNLIKNVAIYWPKLSILNLSHNNLEIIPSEIGHLTSLSSLDVSYNPITTLPDEIGRLINLYVFPLDGLKLRHDSASLGSARDIVSFLQSKLKNAVPYYRLKFMIVGLAGRGKTTLIRQLAQKKHPDYPISTVGVDVNDWILKPKNKKLPSFIMNTWDFAGQEDFYSTHQYFLSPRALYVAVYDVSRGVEEINTLTPWLLNIQAVAPGSLVILVGTHADKIPKERKKDYLSSEHKYVEEYLKSPGFPQICKTAIVNCTKENSAMESLREELYEIVSNFTYKGQKIIKQLVPEIYVQLESMIREEASKMSKKDLLPICSQNHLWKLTTESGIHLNNDEFQRALKFLKETGSLLHFDDISCNLSHLYFIDPQWLCKMMARVVTVKEINPYIDEFGIMLKENAVHLFPERTYPKEFLDRYFRLLRKFEVVLPLSRDKYLVTSKLKLKPSKNVMELQKHFSSGKGAVTRIYSFPYIPNGFWARLITRILSYVDSVITAFKKIPEIKYWKEGIYVLWSREDFFLIGQQCDVPACNDRCMFEIFTSVTQYGFKLLGVLVDLIDSLVEEWYPGLAGDSIEGNNTMIKRLCPCYSCLDKDEPYTFYLNDCVTASYTSDTIECPNCGPRLISTVAPDSVFSDLNRDLIYEECPIEFHDPRMHVLIGSGAFASVYKASVDGTNMAVKVFGETTGSCPNRLLRQEVDILCRLHHPCLMSLIGVCLRPRLLLLEYAPLGNLENTLTSGRGLSRGMQHRIAVQISEGLAYLHQNNIVHRDLKPSNVLVVSLSMGMLINVKITDYGISQESTFLGLAAQKGTSGYQAPEIAKGDGEYHTEVDIFSLGITLYQVVAGGAMPFGEKSFQNELDEAVLSNKAITKITSHGSAPWPDMEHLIRRCILANPDKRPSANDIRNALLSVDLLCLKREAAICKEQSVECMAVRKYIEDGKEKQEVWVASGQFNTGGNQLSWFSINPDKKQTVQGMLVKTRIFCMTSYRHLIIVGTAAGTIMVFNGMTKKEERCLSSAKDSILCLRVILNRDLIIVGVANGSLIFYSASGILDSDVPTKRVDLKGMLEAELPMSLISISCVNVVGNQLLVSFGLYVVEFSLDTFSVSRYWQVSEKNVVSRIETSRSRVLISCKDSCVISVWDFENCDEAQSKIDCSQILIDRYGNEKTERDCRVVTMTVVERVLWVGCGGGDVILIDLLKSTYKPLAMFSRHTSAVRAIVVAPKLMGKSAAVITGGLGFRQLQHLDQDDGNMKEFGFVLVWEADLVKQQKHMQGERKKRDELALQMAEA